MVYSSNTLKDINVKHLEPENIIVLGEVFRNSLASWIIGIMITILIFIFEYLLKSYQSDLIL